MVGVFVSLGLRAIVNLEALNMVESVGNIVRHRKAAIVYKRGGSYVVRWVPTVSGESLAHSYQQHLATVAIKRRLPVCEYCERGEFVKHADVRIFGSRDWERKLAEKLETVEKGRQRGRGAQVDPLALMREVELEIVKGCVVEDVGGFLYAGRMPVKRTSRFSSSFLVPALDAVEKAVVEPQFMVRHAPTASQRWEQAQMPYNVEVGSAVYAWSFYLDASGIGCISTVSRECLPLEERVKRVEAALDALAVMLESRLFGAKLSRFMPVVGYEAVLVTVARPLPFNVSPPAIGLGFIRETVRRARSYEKLVGGEVKVYGYTGSLGDEARKVMEESSVETALTIYELIEKVKSVVLEWVKAEEG